VAWAEPLDEDTDVALVPVSLDELEDVEPVVVEVAAELAEDAAETSYAPTRTAREAAMPPAMVAMRFLVMPPHCSAPVCPLCGRPVRLL
jgi:hypothetical protein